MSHYLLQANIEMIYTQHKMMAYCELDMSDCHHMSPQLVSMHVMCANIRAMSL